jgi:hypothetical protein
MSQNGAGVGEYARRVPTSAGGRGREMAEFDRLPRVVRDAINALRVKPVAAAITPFFDQHGASKTIEALHQMERVAILALEFEDRRLEEARPLRAAFETALRITARRH